MDNNIDVNDIREIAVSTDVAAKLLGVSKPVIYNLIHQGGFPAFKIGRRTLIGVDQLREWVANCVRETKDITW